MEVAISQAQLRRNEDGSYVGSAVFTLSHHKAPYEITFFSTRGTEWDYSLSFAAEPGSEEEFLETDNLLEQDDELYNQLLDAALDTQDSAEEEQ